MWTSSTVGAVGLTCNQRLRGRRRLAEQSLALLILVAIVAGGRRHVVGDRRGGRCGRRGKYQRCRDSGVIRVTERVAGVADIAGIGHRRWWKRGRRGRFGGCRRCWDSDPVQVPECVPHIAGVCHRLSVRDDVGLMIGDLGLRIVHLALWITGLLLRIGDLRLTIGAGLTQEVGKESKLGVGNPRRRIGGQASLILAHEPLQDNGAYSVLRVGKGPCLMVDGAPGCGAGDTMLSDYVVAGIQTARTVGIAVCRLCGAAGSPRVAVLRSRNRTLIFGLQV